MRQNDSRPRFHGAVCAFAAAVASAAIVIGGCGVKGPLRLPTATPGTTQSPAAPPAPAPAPEAMPTETPTTSPQPAEPRKP